MPPITDDPINNSNLGALTLHFPNLLSMARLLVAARPRPIMLGELLDCRHQQANLNHHNDSTRAYEVYEAPQIRITVYALPDVATWSDLERVLPPRVQ